MPADTMTAHKDSVVTVLWRPGNWAVIVGRGMLVLHGDDPDLGGVSEREWEDRIDRMLPVDPVLRCGDDDSPLFTREKPCDPLDRIEAWSAAVPGFGVDDQLPAIHTFTLAVMLPYLIADMDRDTILLYSEPWDDRDIREHVGRYASLALILRDDVNVFDCGMPCDEEGFDVAFQRFNEAAEFARRRNEDEDRRESRRLERFMTCISAVTVLDCVIGLASYENPPYLLLIALPTVLVAMIPTYLIMDMWIPGKRSWQHPSENQSHQTGGKHHRGKRKIVEQEDRHDDAPGHRRL